MESMDGVSRTVLEGLVSDYERALRAVCGEKGLPEAWETRLRSIPRDTPLGLLKTFKWLAVYSELHHQRREQGREVSVQQASQAARQLLRREPVQVTMENGRVVELTSRSYAAAAEIQAHSYAIRDLDLALRETKQLSAELVRRVQFEVMLHRRAIWAHTFTPSGAPATSLEDCPPWWPEITPEDDGRFIMALLQAGPMRYHELGEPPPPKEHGGRREEDFGWASVFAVIEREHRLPAASLYDRDLYQVLAWSRAGAPALPEPKQ